MFMKRGSIFIVSLLMLLGVIILLLLVGKLGINGYAVYDGKFDNLALNKNAGITGNSVLDLIKGWFGGGEGQGEQFLLAPGEEVLMIIQIILLSILLI